MLRALLLVLIVANGLFWAWREGWLSVIGMAPVSQREPQRLQQQVGADVLRVLPGGSTLGGTRVRPLQAPASELPASELPASVPVTSALGAISAAGTRRPPTA